MKNRSNFAPQIGIPYSKYAYLGACLFKQLRSKIAYKLIILLIIRQIRNPVYGNPVPWVQIPPFPPLAWVLCWYTSKSDPRVYTVCSRIKRGSSSLGVKRLVCTDALNGSTRFCLGVQFMCSSLPGSDWNCLGGSSKVGSGLAAGGLRPCRARRQRPLYCLPCGQRSSSWS